MLKEARKPSTDPVQEKLRQSKADWNKEVSIFVNDLIHLKKLMNGWPNKFHMEKSFIKEPIPADPATIIGSLVGDFDNIAQRGNNIVKQQLEYSKNRRKKQPKQLNLPLGTPAPSAPAAPDLSKQLSLPLTAFEAKYDLVAEASNPLSRFFAGIMSPAIGWGEAARIRKYRKEFLNQCVKTYKDFGKLQVEIVGSSKNSIPNANKALHKAWSDWMVFYKGYSLCKSNMPKEIKDSGGEISTSSPDEEEDKPTRNKPSRNKPTDKHADIAVAQKIINDYKGNLGKFSDDADLFSELTNAFTPFHMAQNMAHKVRAAKNIISLYNAIINQLNDKYETSGTTLEQIADSKSSLGTTASLEVLAQDFIKKWIGKTRHELSFFDDKNRSTYRLDIYKKCGEIRKLLDQIMNLLEKDLKIDELDPIVIEVNREIAAIRGVMAALNRIEPPQHKSHKAPPVIDDHIPLLGL